MTPAHAAAVLGIYQAGIDEGNATFETRSPGWSAFIAGKRYRGVVASIPLTRHEEVVLEIGGYIPPHSFFLFATS